MQTLKNILKLLYGDVKNVDVIVDSFIRFETRLAEIMSKLYFNNKYKTSF